MDGFIDVLKVVWLMVFVGVNMLYVGFVGYLCLKEVDWLWLKLLVGGGVVVIDVILLCWKVVMGNFICEGYGLLEMLLVVLFNL